jgi:hypothetical protein
VVFDITPISRFLGPFLAFTDAYDIKVNLPWYHSIDMHCIVYPVKFGDGLFISVQTNKQKNGDQKFTISKKFKFSKAFGV